MFCERCGRNLDDGESFCPECGFPVRDWDPPRAYHQPAVRESDTMLTIASIAVTLYAIFAIAMGLVMVTMGDFIVDMVEQDPSTYEMFGIYPEALRKTLPIMSAVTLASGIPAAISAYFSITRKNHAIAFVSCLAASAVTLLLLDIMSFAIGFVVTFLIYKSKAHFHA